MFSTRPIRPITFTGSFSCAIACIAPSTVAAPAMSHFMVSMPSVGLSDSPPESNVTPLPTSANSRSALRPPRYRSITNRGGRDRTLATASSDPQRSFSSRLVPDFALQPARFGHFGRAGGERFGIHILRRLVHQSAREIDRFAEHLAAPERVVVAAVPDDFLEGMAFLFSAINVLPLAADDRAGHGILGLIGFGIAQKIGDGFTRFAGELFGRRGSGAVGRAGVELVAFAEADNQELRGGDARRSQQRNEFEFFAGNFFTFHELRKQSLGGMIGLLGGATGRFAVAENADDHGIDGGLCERSFAKRDFHGLCGRFDLGFELRLMVMRRCGRSISRCAGILAN